MPFRCVCTLRDCVYFEPVAAQNEECDCKHEEKKFYPHNPCPLYRKNWNSVESGEKMANLKAKFLKKRY